MWGLTLSVQTMGLSCYTGGKMGKEKHFLMAEDSLNILLHSL